MEANKVSKFLKCSIILVSCTCANIKLKAQEGYEIQVYGSPVMDKNVTMIELHSNISPSGPENEPGFTHPLHETVEITTGLTSNFELGLYLFTRAGDGRYQFIGSHLRPRVSVPQSWNWKVGASLSLEVGYVRDPLSNFKDWDYELRPIIDKTIKKHYFSLNPTLEGSFTTGEVSFSPNLKYAFAAAPTYSLGLEYYGSFGAPFKWESAYLQTHAIYAVTDLFLDPRYEVNFGVGHGITRSSDRWNIKLILGRRINWKK